MREPHSVLPERDLVALKVLPGDVARVGVSDEHLPVLLLYAELNMLQARVVGAACASIDERAGIPRVVQDLKNARVVQRTPQQVTLADAAADAPGEQHLLRPHAAQYSTG